MKTSKCWMLGLTLISGMAFGAGKELRIYNWSEYMDPQILKDFEKKTGIKVRQDLFESNEEMVAKLQAGGVSQYDIIVPSNFIVPTLINLKLVQPLDLKKIPNLKNLDPKFKKLPFDPNNKYSVAYQWGTIGLVYNKDVIKKPPTSWAVIFDPKQANKKFVMFDSIREMMAIALGYLGHDINTVDPNQVKAAGKLLFDTKKNSNFQGFDAGVVGKNKVLAGTVTMAVAYNGDAARAMSESPKIGYVLPKEGGSIWVDSLMVPAKAPNKDAAMQFINYILDAKVGAQLSNFIQYATPNKASLPYINAKDRKNPAIYPTEAEIKNLKYIVDLGKNNRLYDEVWTEVKSR
ncbi:polyamine ABC transporter substrate-binding protein [Deinococcus cellulosilyticus]|uniref:Spermidine/putrescine ABC transporter substrate-binding protein n=1 Tax=Deinococcus cellulosilyticus (strain DSM 18568 / NBRC 106333 / KACC 11606 / 5516J-15) TaxID=1223518 RepID=A0A511N5V4_DEIC1|nr:spermidine/putrescine ABC transporter substrate-binding protein [Deinococcus cellulosilyticus]GEM48240.1 spermidine/putrescine ABC transporter substrate-binding protein [Deinococcus cellulosilyticus NBRC 106333 = KACC 11606]